VEALERLGIEVERRGRGLLEGGGHDGLLSGRDGEMWRRDQSGHRALRIAQTGRGSQPGHG
jgi:hypothetical protein